MPFQFYARHTGICNEEVTDPSRQAVIIRVIGVNLGTIAGGENYRLRHVLRELAEGGGQLFAFDAQLLSQIHRGGTVVQSQNYQAQLTASAARMAARLAHPPGLQ